MSPDSVELFAGGGGMALGMHAAGFEHTALVEWDPRAVRVLDANGHLKPARWKPDNVHHEDVRGWLKSAAGSIPQGVDLLAGGPPCQPFSLGGAHAGTADERNMFPASVDAVRLLRPKLAVFENVPGLLRPDFRPYYDYICDSIRYSGAEPGKPSSGWAKDHARILRWAQHNSPDYEVYVETINAADHGAPQVRNRVFLIAIRTDITGSATWTGVIPTHSEAALLHSQDVSGEYWTRHGLPSQGLARAARLKALLKKDPSAGELLPWLTVRDAISDLPDPVDGKEHPTILNHSGIPGARSYVGHTGSDIDWPSKTMKAGVHGVCGGEAMIRFRDGTLRYMTIRESARMQTFPDDYDFTGSRSPVMWTIGNAVAVNVARDIGTQLRAHTGI